jgi:hypothetical protein
VLLNSGVAEHSVAVAVAPAVKALNVVLRWKILIREIPSPQTFASITWSHIP